MQREKKYILFSRFEKKAVLFFVDITIILLSVVYLFNGYPHLDELYLYVSPYVYAVFLYSAISMFFGLYDTNYIFSSRKIIPIIFFGGIIFALAFILTPFIVPSLNYRKIDIIIFILLISSSLSVWRFFFTKIFSSDNVYMNVLLFTSRDFGYSKEEVVKVLHGNQYNNGLKVKNTLYVDDYKPHQLERFKKKINQSAYGMIVLAIDDYTHAPQEVKDFLVACLKVDVLVQSFYKSYQDIYSAIPLRIAQNRFHDVFFLSRSNFNYLYKFFNKFIDYSFCFVGGLLLAVLIPIVYSMNLLFNKGPLFFLQKRIGKGGESFYIYKFRTMIPHDEKAFSLYAGKKDQRLNTWGKLMRKLRIDEIPQIINVFKGDMSLIGPRAEWENIIKTINDKIPFLEVRECVKPGITGWAQVNYKYGEGIEDSIRKLEYDLYYIKNRSVYLDLLILFKTVNSILFSKGQ